MRDSLRRIARRRPAAPAAPASPAAARAARRTRRRRLVVGGTAGALALLLAGGGVAFALGRTGGPGYRTATAELGTVEQTVDTTGTVASATRADRSFSVAGTVGSVAVAVGDAVTAGQVLASLDPASLQDAVDQAEQAVADAQQRLEDDIASQTSSTSSTTTSSSSTSSSSSSAGGATSGAATPDTGSSGGTGGTGGSGGSGGGATDPAVAAAVAAVTAAQQALLAQHETARAALATATDAVAAAQETCRAFLEVDLGGETPEETTPDAADAAEAAAADGGAGTGTGTGTGTTGAEELAACQDATAAVLAAQTAVDEAQTTLSSLATDLDAAVSEALRALAAAAAGSGTEPTTPGATEPGTTTPADTGTTATTPTTPTTGADQSAQTGAPTTGGTGGSGGSGGSTVASAADLLADQAAIDQAEADLAVAQSALGMVDLTTPVAGTVAAVAIAAGDAVEASSTTAVITVLGGDGYTVSTTVSLSQVDLVEVGQTAQVRAGSTDEGLTGTVTGIGLLNASTTSSDPSYTVDIALDPGDAALFDGSSAQVSIAVAASDETLTVPSSAVHLDGGTATVQVLRDGVVEDVEVERGAVGPERTEIADGLAEGDEVVLADLSQAIATDDASSGTGLSGLGGSSDQAPEQVRGGMMVPGGQTGGGQMVAPPGF